MKRLPLLVILISLILNTGCLPSRDQEIEMYSKNKQLIFFSNHMQYKQEASYYDAILELKKDFPEEIKNMKIIEASSKDKYLDNFHIKKCPAILLIEKQQVLVEIKGELTTKEIVNTLSNALKGNENA